MRQLLFCVLVCVSCARRAQETPKELFRDAASETGLRFVHNPGLSGEFHMPEIMGAGAALIDYDNDGDLDVYLLQSHGAPGHRFFRNELKPSGRLAFTDVTDAAGLALVRFGMGVATGDFDDDGFTDLYVTHFGNNVLYRNNGNGTFTDVTAKSPAVANAGRWSSSASFFDYDRDGRLDLVVLNYVNFTPRANQKCFAATGERDYCTPVVYQPVAARLFHNTGGAFEDGTEKAGFTRALGPGLGVVAADLNGDNWPDLFIANDTAQNHLWLNNRDGTFREAALETGVAFSEDGLAKAGMGVAAGDYDGDGDEDLFVLNLMREGATLFRQDKPGNFLDVTRAAGLLQTTFAYTGFGVGFLDYDNDGWLDLFLANGAVTRREEQRGQPYPFAEKNLLLRNDGGKRFIDVTPDAGPAMNVAEVSRGAAFGDIDNDGDVDILITNNNGPARLLLNQTGGRALTITVAETGAHAGLTLSDGRTLWRRVHTDSSYCSASDPRLHFGLGTARAVSLDVIWSDGNREKFTDLTQPIQKIERGRTRRK